MICCAGFWQKADLISVNCVLGVKVFEKILVSIKQTSFPRQLETQICAWKKST